jgi:branched-chain amino acid transport system permease protein
MNAMSPDAPEPPRRGRRARSRLTSSPAVESARGFVNRHPLGRFALPAFLIALLLAYPFYFELPGINVITEDALGLDLQVFTIMAVYAMLALGLNIVVGYAGLLDLGYVAFYALGAYTVGWFASDHFSQVNFHFLTTAPDGLPGIHINYWFVIVLAGVVTAIAGVLIGWPTLRLRGDYLAIVTLGFGEIIPDVFRNADSLRVPFAGHVNLTDGVRGIRQLDRPGFGETLNDATGGILVDRFGLIELLPWFYTIVALLLITIFVNLRLRDSKMGRAWIAVREDEVAASAMGVPLMRTKLWAYAIGAIFGGFAGAFFGSFVGSIFPTAFLFNISIIVLCMVIVGGMGNIYGVLLGALTIQYLNFTGLDKIGARVNDVVGAVGIDRTVEIPKYKFLIFGTLLVLMMLFRPEGLIPSARRKAEFEEGGVEASLYDAKA